jgi:HSP20 family protein
MADSAIFPESRIVNRRPSPVSITARKSGGTVNKLAVQRQSRPLLPELSELLNGFPTFANLPAIAGLRPFFDSNLMRLEDETREGLYQVRAELPGVDPIEDIEVTVRDGQLTIKAERTQASEPNGRSEFSYGSFERTVSLPAGADEDDINATYDRGILTVSVPLSDEASTEKHVEVIETILIDEDEEDEDDDGDDDDGADDENADDADDAEPTDSDDDSSEHNEQEQSAG